MGNITQKQTKINHLAQLPLAVLQLCFHPLDRLSRLRFSRTSHAILQASQSTFAWKYLPPIDLTVQFPSDQPPPPIVDVPIFHSLVRFCGTNLVWKDPEWRRTPNGFVMDPPSINEIAHLRQYPNVQSLTINRRYITASQLDALLLENDNLSHLRTFSHDQGITCDVDFTHTLNTLPTFHKLQHLVLPNVKFTYATYYDLMQLPALTSAGFNTFIAYDWTDAETKSVTQFQFTSKITHLHLSSLGVRPQQPASIALVNHLLSRVSHLTLEYCFDHDEHDFNIFLHALTSCTHLITQDDHQENYLLYRLLVELPRLPTSVPHLTHLSISSRISNREPPSVTSLLTLLTQRPHLHIELRPSDAFTQQQQQRCHRLFQPLEEGVYANRFQLILPPPKTFWESLQWPSLPG